MDFEVARTRDGVIHDAAIWNVERCQPPGHHQTCMHQRLHQKEEEEGIMMQANITH